VLGSGEFDSSGVLLQLCWRENCFLVQGLLTRNIAENMAERLLVWPSAFALMCAGLGFGLAGVRLAHFAVGRK
jgi:hypothetical protein